MLPGTAHSRRFSGGLNESGDSLFCGAWAVTKQDRLAEVLRIVVSRCHCLAGKLLSFTTPRQRPDAKPETGCQNAAATYPAMLSLPLISMSPGPGTSEPENLCHHNAPLQRLQGPDDPGNQILAAADCCLTELFVICWNQAGTRWACKRWLFAPCAAIALLAKSACCY